MHEIQRAFAGLKVGLRALERYVPTKLVRVLLESGEEPKLGGHSQEVTVFFSDIRGFSSFAEGVSPQELAERLGSYLGTLAEIVARHNGTVDKYIGDGVMAFWNAPRPVEEHPLSAVSAALRCVERLREMDPEGRFHTRFGIHTTEAAVGNFGSPDRLNYTVMGDGVNLAARLEGVNKLYGTQILTSEDTARRIAGRIECRAIDRIAVKGRKQPTTIYEPLGEAGRVAPEQLMRARLYERALEAYLARRFDHAAELCAQLLGEDPGDGAASVLRARAEAFSREPPASDWNGVFSLKEK